MTALFLLLFAIVGGFGSITWHNEAPPAGAASSVGYMLCQRGGDHAEVWVNPSAPVVVSVHELAHVVDCFDDGVLNGSPFLVPDHTGPIRCGNCDTVIERWPTWIHTHAAVALPLLKNWQRICNVTTVCAGGALR